jgi:integrating conjugative element protein (TIGR03761 family)
MATKSENQHNPVETAPPRSSLEQPGGLRSATSMTLQTRQAQKIVVGRKRDKGVQPIIGLLDFGRRMKLIWLSAEADDPYADWYLLKVEQALQEARELVQKKKQWLDEVLDDLEGFDIQVASSLQPIHVQIYFQNPYGYMGAYLVADYDALARSVFTARHIGLIARNVAENTLNITGRAIRRTFVLSSQWKFTGVVREDLLQQNQAAQRAIDTFGECPTEILSLEKRANMAPPIKRRANIKTKEGSESDNFKEDEAAESGNLSELLMENQE